MLTSRHANQSQSGSMARTLTVTLFVFLCCVSSFGTAAAETTVAKAAFDFAPDENWTVWEADKRPGIAFAQHPEHAELTIDLRRDEQVAPLFLPGREGKRFGPSDKVYVVVTAEDLPADATIRLAPIFVDADREGFSFEPKAIKPGQNVITFDLIRESRPGWGSNDVRNGEVDEYLWLWDMRVLVDSYRHRAARPVKLRFERMEIDVPIADAELVLEFDSGAPYGLVDPAGDVTPAWVVRNPFGTEIEDVVVAMTTTDFEGAVDTQSVTVSVPARGQTRVPLPESMWRDAMSMYYVEAQLSRNGEAGAQGEGKFTTLTPTGLADQDADYEFRFGINHVHDGHAARAAGLIGAMDARFDFTFPGIFRESGEIDWNFAGRDTGFDEVLAEGLNIHPLIGYNTYHNAPDGAKPTGFHEDWGTWIFTYPLDLEAYRQKVRQWAERYASRVTWVEPWNEPGWMGVNKARREWYDNERYIEILRIVNEEIKRVNPEIQINTGGFANTHDPMGLHDHVLEHGRDYFEVHLNHAHGHFNHIRKEVATIKEMREKNGITDRPLYFNETSTSHIFPTAAMEKHVAGHLVRTAVYLWANGVAGHLWFEIDDIGWIDRDDYNRWGMWTENWEPKAVVPAYNTLTSRIRGARFVERFETVEDQYIYLFERGEAGQDGHEWILSTWRHGQKTADEVFGLRIPEGSQATAYNLVGTRQDVVA
ncbi:MAG: hypothetical protein AAGE65_14690, partial [Planctomycetota bacterium]